jgi:hypothetical protein
MERLGRLFKLKMEGFPPFTPWETWEGKDTIFYDISVGWKGRNHPVTFRSVTEGWESLNAVIYQRVYAY